MRPERHKATVGPIGHGLYNQVREEIGLTVTNIEPLGSICGDTGLIAGITEAFFVQVGNGEVHPSPDQHEAFGDLLKKHGRPVTLKQALKESLRRHAANDPRPRRKG